MVKGLKGKDGEKYWRRRRLLGFAAAFIAIVTGFLTGVFLVFLFKVEEAVSAFRNLFKRRKSKKA